MHSQTEAFDFIVPTIPEYEEKENTQKDVRTTSCMIVNNCTKLKILTNFQTHLLHEEHR